MSHIESTKDHGWIYFSLSTSIISYITWRGKVLRLITDIGNDLALQGFVTLPSSISCNDKTKAWNNIIEPVLKQHWLNHGFDPCDISTFPSPETKPYHLSYNKPIDGLLPICSSNFILQAVIAYIIDPSLSLIHYGSQSSLCFMLIAGPCLISRLVRLQSVYQLYCIDQSWHIVNIPDLSNGGMSGKAKNLSAHIDSGADGIFAKDVLSNDALLGANASLSPAGKILYMMMHQLAVVIHCETPGVLGEREGSTGLYRHSHIQLLQSLKDIYDSKIRHISWSQLQAAIKQYCSGINPTQAILHDDEILLMMGSLVHTPMTANSLMNGRVRVINNCKIHARDHILRDKQRLINFIRHIPRDSILSRLADSPSELLSDLEAARRLQIREQTSALHDMMYHQISM